MWKCFDGCIEIIFLYVLRNLCIEHGDLLKLRYIESFDVREFDIWNPDCLSYCALFIAF